MPDSASWDRLPCGLLTAGPRGAVLASNDTLRRWLGYEAGEIEQLEVKQLLTIGGRLFHQTHLAPLLQMQGSVGEVQLQLRHRDGSPVPVLTAIRRLRDAGGEVIDQYAFMHSGDRRKYEEELLAARQRAEVALEVSQRAPRYSAQVQRPYRAVRSGSLA